MARIVTGRRMVVRDAEDCLKFDGSGDYAEVVSSQMASISGEATVCFWINFAGKQSGNSAFLDCQWGNDNAGGWQFYKMSGQNKWRGFAGDYSGRDVFMNSGQPFVPGRWYFIAVTKKASANRMTTYVDAVVVEERTNCTFGMEKPADGYNLRIGGNRVGGAEASCSMSDVMIFDKELTASEIQNIYYSHIIPSSIIHHWKMDEASGSVATDSKGSANASITGASWSLLGPMKLRAQATNRFLVRDFGGSTLFDGAASVVKILNQPIYNLVNYSVSFWINATYNADDKYIISNCRSSSNTPLFGISYKRPSGNYFNLKVFIRDDSSNVLSGAGDVTPQNLVHGRWYHITITDAGGSLKCYVNGVYQGINIPYTRGTLTLDQTSFGALWRTSVSNYFLGKLADVRIYNKSLSASEALNLYLSGNASVVPVAPYALNDTPPTYIDSVGGKNGTGISTAKSTDVPMKARDFV